jgi:co-chaperonin GroES (HSP10)
MAINLDGRATLLDTNRHNVTWKTATTLAEFPRTPLLDRIIVREIAIEEYYEQPKGVSVDLQNAHIKERSDRGEVVAVGDCVIVGGVRVDMPVAIGDTVFYDPDSVLYDPVYLNPAHKHRTDLPRYWQIRVHDLKGYSRA